MLCSLDTALNILPSDKHPIYLYTDVVKLCVALTETTLRESEVYHTVHDVAFTLALLTRAILKIAFALAVIRFCITMCLFNSLVDIKSF